MRPPSCCRPSGDPTLTLDPTLALDLTLALALTLTLALTLALDPSLSPSPNLLQAKLEECDGALAEERASRRAAEAAAAASAEVRSCVDAMVGMLEADDAAVKVRG